MHIPLALFEPVPISMIILVRTNMNKGYRRGPACSVAVERGKCRWSRRTPRHDCGPGVHTHDVNSRRTVVMQNPVLLSSGTIKFAWTTHL
jgi:hypothetical protein